MRKDKRKALNAWRKAVARAGANRAEAVAQLMAGAIRYRDDPNREDTFTKYPEGWLNGDRWLDDPLPEREVAGRRPDPPRPMTSGDMRDYIREQTEGSGDVR